MEVVRKVRLDGKVATLLGKKRAEVSEVTEAFLKEAARELVARKCVRFDGFGEMHIYFKRPKNKVRELKGRDGRPAIFDIKRESFVSFKKAAPLGLAIRQRYGPGAKERPMDKLGVDETADPDLEKEAASGCPICGRKPERHGNVLICSNCGSEPFEKKKK